MINLPLNLGKVYRHTIFGSDAEDPYMTRYIWKRTDGSGLRLHVIHRGDNDPDPHDHPFSFWTFPLVGYWEEVWIPTWRPGHSGKMLFRRQLNYVKPFRWHFRSSNYIHRIMQTDHKIYTLVSAKDDADKKWGFWVPDGSLIHCPTAVQIDSQFLEPRKWVAWKEYLGLVPGS